MHERYLEAAENLEKVAAMVEVDGLWCKNNWATVSNLVAPATAKTLGIRKSTLEEPKGIGCAEGLLMDVLGLYSSKGEFGELRFFTIYEDGGEEEEAEPDYWVDQLRQTEEWTFLDEAVRLKTGLRFGGQGGGTSRVTSWNDNEETTEDDVVEMFHKAAFLAKQAGA